MKMVEIPKQLRSLPPEFVAESLKLANQYAEKGTVKHFALRMGFMPHNEADAEAILKRIIDEHDWLETELERIK